MLVAASWRNHLAARSIHGAALVTLADEPVITTAAGRAVSPLSAGKEQPGATASSRR